MKQLETVQVINNLNRVYVLDEPHEVNAGHHRYSITTNPTKGWPIMLLDVRFQNGPRKEKYSIQGILDVDLLEIVRHRLKSFQKGPFQSQYNDDAIYHVEMALAYLNERMLMRDKAGTLGTNKI